MHFSSASALCFLLVVSAAEAARTRRLTFDGGDEYGRTSFNFIVPNNYDARGDYPLIVHLHAFCLGGSRAERLQPAYYQTAVDRRQFVYVQPSAIGVTKDCPTFVCETGLAISPIRRERFFARVATRDTSRAGCPAWEATEACCVKEIPGAGDRDVILLTNLLAAAKSQLAIDPARVYFSGFANGAFMSYRMACELAEDIAAIATYGGATFNDPALCSPSAPVRVLHTHGKRDAVVLFTGGDTSPGLPYPSARTTTRTWARYNGCENSPETSTIPNFRRSTNTTYLGCDLGGAVRLYLLDTPHIIAPNNRDGRRLLELNLEFLLGPS